MKNQKKLSGNNALFLVVCMSMTCAIVGLINQNPRQSETVEASSATSNLVAVVDDTAVPLSGDIYDPGIGPAENEMLSESNRFTIQSWDSHNCSYKTETGEVKSTVFEYFIIRDEHTGSSYAVFIKPVNEVVKIH